MLDIPLSNVFANTIIFNVGGAAVAKRCRKPAACPLVCCWTMNRKRHSNRTVYLLRNLVCSCPPAACLPACPPARLPACLQEDGSHAGFDTAEFPSRSGGKRDAVQHIKTVSRAEACRGAGGMVDCNARSAPRCIHLPLPRARSAPHRPRLLPLLPHLQTHGFQTVVMVGDGMTDCEARAPGGADAFIG